MTTNPLHLAVIEGEGIGPEIMEATLRVLESIGLSFVWEEVIVGERALKLFGDSLPAQAIETMKKCDGVLKGPLNTPLKGYKSVNVRIREELGLYANVRPSKNFDGVDSRYDKVDVAIVRENTEGFYTGLEINPDHSETGALYNTVRHIDPKRSFDGAAYSIGVTTPLATKNIIRFALDYALRNNRKKITCVHKATIFKATDGMFLDIFERYRKNIFSKYDIESDTIFVDNAAQQLVLRPESFDVLVCPNLYGDILSDLCAGLVGGLGVAAGLNVGKKHVMAEAVHGTWPTAAGQNRANPAALILSAVLMLRHLGFTIKALLIENAVKKVLAKGTYVTTDLNPNGVGTKEMTNAIIREIHARF